MDRCQIAGALLGALTCAPVVSQTTLRTGSPDEVGMSESILRSGITLFEAAVAADDLRGAVLLVARQGVIVLHEALGWRDVDRQEPMEKDTLFRMASNTKPVVAAGVMTLVDDNKLGLDDNVRQHIASFDNHRAAYITLRQLLSHTSGLRISTIFYTPLIARSAQHPDAPNLQVEVNRFGEVGAEIIPGTSYSYSNPGFNTLGALIEIGSGSSLGDYLRQRIYEPLGMSDSSNHESVADNSRMSAVFTRGRRGGALRARWSPGDTPDYPFVRASGGMISTAPDYVIFCQMFLNGGTYGGTRILSEASVRAATSPQTRHIYTAEELAQVNSFYGLGWSVSADGTYSHGGSDGTYAWVDPNREIIGIVFTQTPGGRNPRAQFKRVVEASLY